MGFTDYAAGRPGARFSDWLKAEAEPFWSAAVGHRFTRELADDSLPDAVYRRYLIEDYGFIDALVRHVAHAIVVAPDMPPQSSLAAFLAAVTSEENDYFLRSFEALGVPEAEWQSAGPGQIGQAFGEVLAEAAEDGSYESALVVLLAAEWCYEAWAGAVADKQPARFYLREWIELHANPAFKAFVGWLREDMDRRGPAMPPTRQDELARLFRRMMELEEAFFDDAYKG